MNNFVLTALIAGTLVLALTVYKLQRKYFLKRFLYGFCRLHSLPETERKRRIENLNNIRGGMNFTECESGIIATNPKGKIRISFLWGSQPDILPNKRMAFQLAVNCKRIANYVASFDHKSQAKIDKTWQRDKALIPIRTFYTQQRLIRQAGRWFGVIV
ncbi:MAG TPA: hypothetical protein PKI61_00990 [bacterium]|nr:hypothetical protein [bacterium]HPT29341.1 hypothetical protein [bacterium]